MKIIDIDDIPGRYNIRHRRDAHVWHPWLLFKKLDIPTGPLVLTLILGPLLERGLRQSPQMSQGDFSIFFSRPFSATLLAIAPLMIVTFSFRALAPIKGE